MIKKGNIVEVRLSQKYIIKITKVLKGYCKGIVIKTGQICDFGTDTIYKIVK